MFHSKICLSLTASTIEEDLKILEKYRNRIDVAELRVDCLLQDERLKIRTFPELAKIPCILSIKRAVNGGCFTEGESSRTVLFARGIAFANQDTRKNFAYIDLEEDFNVSSIQDAALAFGTRIIRSIYVNENDISTLPKRLERRSMPSFEIPKIVFQPQSLQGVTELFTNYANKSLDYECIFDIGGLYSMPATILAQKLHSHLTYTLPKEMINDQDEYCAIDPETLEETYNYRSVDKNTKVFGIVGNTLIHLLSPSIHNLGYKKYNLNNVFVPIRSSSIEEAFAFAKALNIDAMSVGRPFKSEIIPYLATISEKVGESFSCDSIIKKNGEWQGLNMGVEALIETLKELSGRKNLWGYKVAIIGSSAEATNVAYALKALKAKACVFSNKIKEAKTLAEQFGIKWSALNENSINKLVDYSDLIIQTKGANPDLVFLGGTDLVQDPMPFYDFSGNEIVFDCTYNPKESPCLKRARKAGCKTANAFEFMTLQAKWQFELFTGIKYE